MRTQVVLVLACAAFAAAALPSCTNPMFQGPNSGVPPDYGTLSLLSLPTTNSFPGMCSSWSGKFSCCGLYTFPSIQANFDAMGKQITEAKRKLGSVSRSQVAQALSQLQAPGAIQSAVMDAYDAVVTAANDGISCVGGILGYLVGMLCLSCDPYWSTYISQVATTIYVSVEDNTCTGVYGTCSGVFSTFMDLMKKSVALMDAMVASRWPANLTPQQWQQITQSLAILRPFTRFSSICEALGVADCQSLLCNNMLHGLDIEAPFNATTLQQSSPAQRLAAMLHRAMPEAPREALSQMMKLAMEHPMTAEHIRASPVAALFTKLASPSGNNVRNRYVASGGYDAYTVGCSNAAGVDNICPQPSSSKALPAWAIALIVIVVLLVVALIAFVVFRMVRARGTASTPAGSTAPYRAVGDDYAASYHPAPSAPYGQVRQQGETHM